MRLKQARIALGLSQRALGERSGLTQSHISQIENGTTEPGLSSLIELTRALDLEVMVIPRKRILAVSSLINERTPIRQAAHPAAQRELERGQRVINELASRIGNTALLDRIREALAFFSRMPLSSDDLLAITDALGAFHPRQEQSEMARRVREAADMLSSIRSRLVQIRSMPRKAVYALEDQDDADA